MWWSHSLRKIDIFGTKFGFRVKNEESYKTVFGGILTIMSFITTIIFGVFFGQDFYYRINPSVYSDSIVPEVYDRPVTLTPENFTIAWRIEDNNKLGVNFTNIIYPIMSRFRYKRNTTTNEMETVEEANFQLTRCNAENTKMKEFTENYKMEEWYCFDWTSRNFSFGGFWDGDYLNAFTVQIYLCKEGQSYNETSSNCTKLDDFRKFNDKSNGLMVSIMYPQFFFASEDLKNPLRITYRNFYYYFNLKTLKIDRMFFNKVNLKDDQGWIFDDTKLTSTLSFTRMQSESDIKEWYDGGSSTIYASLFYSEKGSQNIRRSFMKIQDVSAKVGGLIKLVMTVFSVSNLFFSNFHFQISIFDEIFEFPESTTRSSKTVARANYNISLKSRNELKNSSNIQMLSPRARGKASTLFQGQKKEPIIQTLGVKIPVAANIIEDSQNAESIKPIKLNNYISHRVFSKKDLPAESNNESLIKNENNTNTKFSMWLILKGFCSSPSKDSDIKKIKVFKGLESYLNRRMDLIYYLRTLYTLDITHSLLFNPTQKKMLEYPFKPNIFSKEDLHSFGLDKKLDATLHQNEVSDYFGSRLKEKKMDKFDRKIFKILPQELTGKIENREEIIKDDEYDDEL